MGVAVGTGSSTMMSCVDDDLRRRPVAHRDRDGAAPRRRARRWERREHNRDRDRETLILPPPHRRPPAVLKKETSTATSARLDTIENMDAYPRALDHFEEEFRSARGGRQPPRLRAATAATPPDAHDRPGLRLRPGERRAILIRPNPLPRRFAAGNLLSLYLPYRPSTRCRTFLQLLR